MVDRPHPLHVAAGQVVVDRDQVRAAPGERVQVERQRRDQRLALAGLHLGDLALVQDDAAEALHVEVAQADGAPRRLAHGRERLRQDLVEGDLLGRHPGRHSAVFAGNAESGSPGTPPPSPDLLTSGIRRLIVRSFALPKIRVRKFAMEARIVSGGPAGVKGGRPATGSRARAGCPRAVRGAPRSTSSVSAA